MKKLIVLLLVCFLIISCGKAYCRQIESKTMRIEGEINADFFRKIKAFIDSGGKTLIVTSFGGDINYGIKIGSYILNKDVTIIVDKYCFSSCANYIFLGAKKKILNKNSILGFHGWASVSNNDQRSNQPKQTIVESKINTLHKKELLFFKKLNLNTAIFKHAFDFVKNDENIIEVTIFDKTPLVRKFPATERVKAAQFVVDSIKSNNQITWEMKFVNLGVQSSVFFPNKSTLLRYGINNLLDYSYPINQEQLTGLAKKISEDLNVVGDFKDIN